MIGLYRIRELDFISRVEKVKRSSWVWESYSRRAPTREEKGSRKFGNHPITEEILLMELLGGKKKKKPSLLTFSLFAIVDPRLIYSLKNNEHDTAAWSTLLWTAKSHSEVPGRAISMPVATSSLSWFSFCLRGFLKSFFWRCCSL